MSNAIELRTEDLTWFREFRQKHPDICCKNCAFGEEDGGTMLMKCNCFNGLVFRDHFCAQFIREEVKKE